MIRMVATGALVGLFAILALGVGCQSWDGHIALGKYSTRPVYDAGIRTVRVPVFKNKTQVFQGNSGIENESPELQKSVGEKLGAKQRQVSKSE